MRGFRFLVNPRAREGAARARIEGILGRLSRHHAVEVRAVCGLEAARSAVRDLPGGWVPVAVGGDGTMNLLVRALREEGLARRTCATLPMGTGNAFAHSIDAGSTRAAVRTLVAGVPRAMDLLVTSHPDMPIALVSISTGFEARVIGRLARRRAWRRLAAIWECLPDTFRAPARGASLTLDGRPFVSSGEPLFNLGLYNMRCYAFGRPVFPGADPGDGAADAVACASARSYWGLIGRGVGRNGPRHGRGLRMSSWRRAEIDAPAGCQFDGEPARGGRFQVRVEPRALRVLVPRTGRSPARV